MLQVQKCYTVYKLWIINHMILVLSVLQLIN